jgi:hypothetical protein
VSGLDEPVGPPETVRLFVRMPREEIAFVSALLCGYDGLCLSSTPDETPEVLRLEAAATQMELLRAVLHGVELVTGHLEIDEMR